MVNDSLAEMLSVEFEAEMFFKLFLRCYSIKLNPSMSFIYNAYWAYMYFRGIQPASFNFLII